jgi:hypothetical protein
MSEPGKILVVFGLVMAAAGALLWAGVGMRERVVLATSEQPIQQLKFIGKNILQP